MKFALSTLSTAVMTVTLMGLAASHSANANDDVNTSQNEVAPVVVTQIVDADTPSSLQGSSGIKNSVQENGTQITYTQTDKNPVQNSIIKNKAAPIETQPVKAEPNGHLTTLIDPITHKSIDNSYPLEVSSLLSLEQAQNILLQVSPKIAANQAAIAASEYETDALKTIDHPLVFARASATAYNLDADVDLSSIKNGIINDVNSSIDGIDPPIDIENLPDFGELVGDRIPDNYDLKRNYLGYGHRPIHQNLVSFLYLWAGRCYQRYYLHR